MPQRGQIRIIGGKWRGRKLKVPTIANLRPTPDRVRETVFNWLAPYIEQAHCIDLFAGSGALGFEALSRGAASVVMIDQSRAVVELLKEEAQHFQTTQAEIYCAQVPEQLRLPSHPFDIVFLDPPFKENVLLPTCFYLEKNDFLAANAVIYIEAPELITDEVLPSNWKVIKEKKAGQVGYHLIKRS